MILSPNFLRGQRRWRREPTFWRRREGRAGEWLNVSQKIKHDGHPVACSLRKLLSTYLSRSLFLSTPVGYAQKTKVETLMAEAHGFLGPFGQGVARGNKKNAVVVVHNTSLESPRGKIRCMVTKTVYPFEKKIYIYTNISTSETFTRTTARTPQARPPSARRLHWSPPPLPAGC